MQFPLTLTWAQIAELPGAAEAFGYDEDYFEPDDPTTTLEGHIAHYSEAFTSSQKLATYLGMIGYELTNNEPLGEPGFTGIRIRSEIVLQTANALFEQIGYEYDDPDCPRIPDERGWLSTPTWALFELGGDDDVDYCGGMPSCLTLLLLEAIDAHRED